MARKMTEKDFENWLGSLFQSAEGFEFMDEDPEDDDSEMEWGVVDVVEYGEMAAEYLTRDAGLWITMSDGTKFQVTIKQEK